MALYNRISHCKVEIKDYIQQDTKATSSSEDMVSPQVLCDKEFHQILSGLESGAHFEDLSNDVDDE